MNRTDTSRFGMKGLLNAIERAGNKVPHPAVLFFLLIVIVIVLSHLLHWMGTSVAYQRINVTTHEPEGVTKSVNSLLSANGALAAARRRRTQLARTARTKATAYRVSDSPPNVINPLLPHFALVFGFAQQWQKDAGVGTVVAMMLPYSVATFVAWTLLFFARYWLGISFGPS